MYGQVLQFLFVALVWGCTNPLLKRGSVDIEKITVQNKLKRALLQLKLLLLTPSFTVPFLVNQSGSVFYYLAVANSNISVAVPVINSLTLVVTTLTGRLMGEQALPVKSYIGMALVVTGVCIAVLGQDV